MKVCDADKCMFVCMYVVSAAVHGILYNMSIITRKHVSHSAPRYIHPPVKIFRHIFVPPISALHILHVKNYVNRRVISNDKLDDVIELLTGDI